MAYIQDIRFDHVGKKEGFICDQCGAYITNVYTVTYSDGLKMHYGIECFKKLFIAGSLTEQGVKLMKKALKRIKEAYEIRDKWLKVNSFEEAKEQNIPYWAAFEDEAWEGSSFEEFKEYCVDEKEGYFASDIRRARKDLERFKKINFDLSKLS